MPSGYKLHLQVRRSQADKPIHSPRDSLISWTSGFQNYEGFVNWAFLLLAMGGLRLFLENINKWAFIDFLTFHLMHLCQALINLYSLVASGTV